MNGEQMTIDDLLGVKGPLKRLSSDELAEIIEKLQEVKHLAQKRESDEQKKKELEGAKQREAEAQQKKAAHIREVTCMDLPLDWENAFASDERTQGVHAESISDGLILSLSNLGKVDIEYISSVTGAAYKSVICALRGAIYQNPDTWNECFYQGWETAEEYLSGNLMRKWKAAKTANEEYDGYFSENIRAIEKVLPPAVATEEIYITLGSPWIPADIIDDFIRYLFGDPFQWREYYGSDRDAIMDAWKTVHDEITGTWEIPGKSRYDHNLAMRKTYGTKRIEALHILEKTLNMKTLTVTDEVVNPVNTSGKKRVVNQGETIAALEKQKKLIQAFQKWVWTNEQRKERLERIFEDKYSCVRRRIFDGSFLQFPGLSPEVQLRPYQKNAVARILFTPNTLLAHDVGSGKTYVMIAAGQELRRMRLSKKNLYVVPNNIIGQWKGIFLTMYPNARLLCVEPKTFTPQKREGVLQKIRDEDFDGILMAYSCFEQIPLSKACCEEELRQKKEQIIDILAQRKQTTSRLRRKQEAIERALSKLELAMDDLYDTICFDELGITRMFVDEAHNFKNVPIETQINSVLGISAEGSKKCRDMMDKVRMIQRKNEGRGVVMATGTPITNSITDVYVLQQYLQSGELGLLDLQSFDSWVGMFAERVTEFEIDVDTGSYRLATRFAKFHNLPELTVLLSSIADFHAVDTSAGIPAFDGHQDALIAKTGAFSAYLKNISQRADDVRRGIVNRSEDNMLKITTDGRKAALDLRLVDPTAAFTYQSKAARCAENVADLYFRTAPQQGTQLIFCDTSTPKAGFNLYSELKDLLLAAGIPETQIAFIHDAKTEARRASLFARVRSGDVRVLIGSTFKLGLGVNVQDKLVALHHLDIPWRPADMTQREGRILRQGNTNPRIFIYRYITEGSFDAYSWQLLETKQRFISDLLSGSLSERSSSDVEGTVLDYAEVKALAVGNPLVKQRVEAANELARFQTLQRKLVESRMALETELLELPAQIQNQRENIQKCQEDLVHVRQWRQDHPAPSDTRGKQQEADQRRILRESIGAAIRDYTLEPKEKPLLEYRDFQITLPANMEKEKPYLWLTRQGKYYVELGDTEIGNLVRIDHFLDHLEDHLTTMQDGLKKLQKREADIRRELSKDESYTDEIARCKEKVAALDQQLGVERT